MHESTAVAFQDYRRPLEMVTTFQYRGRVITASDDDWPVVVDKLWKARSRWAYLSRILGREGADPWTFSNFYKVVFQSNLLFGSETWVVTLRIGRTLGGFHHRMARCLAAIHPKQNMVGR